MKKKFILLVIFVLVIGIFAGCTPPAEKPLDDPNIADPYDYNNYGPNTDPYNYNRRNGTGRDLLDDNVNNKVNPSVDERSIERLVNQINGVDNCVVVVDGDTAYCGVDTDGMTNTQVNSLRTKVIDQVKDSNANIDNVYVTTDQVSIDDMTRLKREADMTNTRNNKMLEGIKGYFR